MNVKNVLSTGVPSNLSDTNASPFGFHWAGSVCDVFDIVDALTVGPEALTADAVAVDGPAIASEACMV